jgi:protein ImuB
VGAPALADTHRPDAWALARPGDDAGAPDAAAPGRTLLGLRALRPPLPARVVAPRGTPERVESALARGAVLRCAGPWRTTGHWWSEGVRFAFDHYDVQTADGWVVRLRFDWIARAWQIDGVYD